MYQSEFAHRLRASAAMLHSIELEAARLLIENQIRLFTHILWEQPEKAVWTNMAMPTELFFAHGLEPVHTELAAGWISSLGLADRYIRIAEGKGYHVNLCSYHKAVIGAMECGDLPAPKFAVCSSHICDGGNGLLQYFSNRFQTTIRLIDVPYHKTDGQAALALESQLRTLHAELGRYTGRPVRFEALQQAADCSDQQRELWMQANRLRRSDCLFYGNYAIRNLFGASFLYGSSKGVEVARAYLRQLRQKRDAPSLSPLPQKAVRRILWIHFAPLFAGELMRFFEQQLGCVIAFDITGHIYWPPVGTIDPIGGIARKAMSHFYLGGAKERMALYERIVADYKIEGIVLFMHQGCRAIPGAAWELRLLANRLHLPLLELPGDCIDPRGLSAAQTKLRMEAFRESFDSQENA